MNNILTIDVEDYFHVAALSNVISVNDWDSIKPRVYDNTKKILNSLDKHEQKATFFILGWVAERFPDLVNEIDKMGHEVACHGYSHQLVYNQSVDTFYKETLKAKNILEDIISKPVYGYRAASYSITKKSLWALDILSELGFTYDSSIFPVMHDRYGIADSPTEPYIILTQKGYKITEYPLSIFKLFNYNLPIAGGGYFRLYPYWLTRFLYKLVNRNDSEFVFYLHPWEVDPNQPKIKAKLLSRFRHYNNLNKTQSRFEALLSEFKFVSMIESIKTKDLDNRSDSIIIDYRKDVNNHA